MNATFKLNDSTTLEIGADIPRSIHDVNSIGLLVTRTLRPLGGLRSGADYAQDEPAPEPPPDAIFYGPFSCDMCGCMIVQVSREHGGKKFDVPDGPIYPNTKWDAHLHRQPPPVRPETVMAVALVPSHARAVASALLAAATEARNG